MRKIYRTCKNYYSWSPSTCVCENGKYIKSIADTLVIAYDEVIYVMDTVLTDVANTIWANDTSINSDDKKVRYKLDYYILHTVLLVIILLFIIAIISYHYAKHRTKKKGIDALTI